MANLSIFKNLVSKSLIKRVKTADIQVDNFIERLCDNEGYTLSLIEESCIVERSLLGVMLICDEHSLMIDCEFLRFGMEVGETCNFYEWCDALRFFLSEIEGRVNYWQSKVVYNTQD